MSESKPKSLIKTIALQTAAGGSAGFVEVCIMHPLDLVKTRLQIQNTKKSNHNSAIKKVSGIFIDLICSQSVSLVNFLLFVCLCTNFYNAFILYFSCIRFNIMAFGIVLVKCIVKKVFYRIGKEFYHQF